MIEITPDRIIAVLSDLLDDIKFRDPLDDGFYGEFLPGDKELETMDGDESNDFASECVKRAIEIIMRYAVLDRRPEQWHPTRKSWYLTDGEKAVRVVADTSRQAKWYARSRLKNVILSAEEVRPAMVHEQNGNVSQDTMK